MAYDRQNGDFTTVREVLGSESSCDIVMGDSILAAVSAMDLDGLDASATQADMEDLRARGAADHRANRAGSANAPRPGLLPGAELPVRLLVLEDAKSEEYYKAADQMGQNLAYENVCLLFEISLKPQRNTIEKGQYEQPQKNTNN